MTTCIVTAQQVVCPHLSNMAIGQFMGVNQRLYSECRFPTDHQLPYEAFKTAEVGDEKEGGIELSCCGAQLLLQKRSAILRISALQLVVCQRWAG